MLVRPKFILVMSFELLLRHENFSESYPFLA